MKTYCWEHSEYLSLTILFCDVVPQSAIDFVSYICSRIEETELEDPDEASPIPHSHHPAGLGREYYFRKDGLQIRTNHAFTVDNCKSDYADVPASERCTKNYVKSHSITFTSYYLKDLNQEECQVQQAQPSPSGSGFLRDIIGTPPENYKTSQLHHEALLRPEIQSVDM